MPGAAAISVLLVENEERDFDATARVLRDSGMQVTHATTVIDALDLLRGPRPIDLLVAAVRLPGQPSGFTLARMARRKRPQLAVVYLSSGGDVPETEVARALGPILKLPAAPEAIAEAIRGAVAPDVAARPV